MNSTTQFGQHPDADTLTAFTEQMLSDAERESVLAHMAVCGRCREVVFLAEQALEVHETVPSRRPEAPRRKVAAGWLTDWRWSFVPIAALTGVVCIAVLRHNRHADLSPKQTAQNVAPPAAIGNEARLKDSMEPQRQSKSSAERKGGVNEGAERDKRESARVLDRQDRVIAQKKDQYAKDTDLPDVFASGAGGSVAGQSKSLSAPSPVSPNQVSGNNPQTRQQGSSSGERQLEGSANTDLNRPYPAKMKVAHASESVSVQAAAAMAPSSAATSSAPQLAGDSLQLSLSNRKLAKAARLILPSGLDVLSEASQGQIEIAIDTAGSLFFSEDGGKHWHGVKPPWTGRAVSVRTLREADAGSANALTRPSTKFELSTDDAQKWMSVDGQHWSLEPQNVK